MQVSDYIQQFSSFFPDPKVWEVLAPSLNEALQTATTGNAPRWMKAWEALPDIPGGMQGHIHNQDTPEELKAALKLVASCGKEEIPPTAFLEQLKKALKMLMPWRKGPWDYFGIDIDTEWRSNLKWDRIAPHLPDLTDKRVADIGCGNGYYMMRMLAYNPRWVLGLDPSSLFLYQFLTFMKYAGFQTEAATSNVPAYFWPTGMEILDQGEKLFDVLFFMGVLYHRISPIDCIKQLSRNIDDGGKLILETLTIEGSGDMCLSPLPRYAQMRNVYFLPTDDLLVKWTELNGFENVRIIDVETTTTEEQRKTDWIISNSLNHFLDPNDHTKTIEGYPAPRRTLLMATRKKRNTGVFPTPVSPK